MKKITFRELLNLMYRNNAPKQIKYKGELYETYGYHGVDYHNEINNELLSSVIGEDITLSLMARDKIITIYDEILDDKEKEYLSNIIKPFKKYVRYIRKEDPKGQEQLIIIYKDYIDKQKDSESSELDTFYSRLCLPTFKAGTMYRGLELWKEYTLEELGL